MKKSISVILVLAAGLLASYEASGWGGNTHQFINRKVVYHLPNQMMLFIQDSSFFAQHASDADSRRVSGDTSMYAEGPRHYLDIDDYPGFRTMSRSFDTLVIQYGWERVKSNGTNPWATIWNYDSLVNQLRRGDWTKARLTASDLGHYVGDANQPLHCTLNYDGQLTNQRGIHSRYESTMLSSSYYLSQLTITPDSVRYIADRINYIFEYIIHSNALVDSVLQADLYAKAASGWSGSGSAPAAYYNALWNRTRTFTLDQVQRATVHLGSLWYTAWVDAGLITPTGIAALPATLPADFGLEQNFPNPFNPSTTIRYTLPVGGSVRLTVYTLAGEEVATILNEMQSAGEHAVSFSASSSMASGVYLYRLQLGSFYQTKKMVLVK